MIEGHSIRRKRDLASRRERHFVVSGLTALGTALGATAGTALATGAVAAGLVGSAAAGTAYSIAAGERGAGMQRQAMRRQQQAQTQATAQARSQQRQSQEAMAMANRREPDIATALASGMADQAGGPASTMLTGPGGVEPSSLMLGRQSLLGG